MTMLKNDDILGYAIDGEHICPKCVTPEEKREATMDTLITLEELGVEDRCFCDRCEKEIC